jgi:hypothetical protein
MRDEQWVKIQESMTDEEREHLLGLHRNLADTKRRYHEDRLDIITDLVKYQTKLRRKYCEESESKNHS